MQERQRQHVWLDISFSWDGDEVTASAVGSNGARALTRPLGAAFRADALRRFGDEVRAAAERHRRLSGDTRRTAERLREAIFRGDLGSCCHKLVEQAQEDQRLLLVRITVARGLEDVPWEALCRSDQEFGCWATSDELAPAYSVATADGRDPLSVRGAVRVLAIAPALGSASLSGLELALKARVASRELEWLEPLSGSLATFEAVKARMQREPYPHILHFLGHGRVRDDTTPELQFADLPDGQADWRSAELLGRILRPAIDGGLELVVLESCDGARSTDFASAAESLARTGVAAVVAHRWPVQLDVAHTVSTEFYRALTGHERTAGDVAASLNSARTTVLEKFDGSAEAFSPVLFLRAPDSVLFDFSQRTPPPPPGIRPDPALARLVQQRFSVVLGDGCEAGFLEMLRGGLPKTLPPTTSVPQRDLPITTVAQFVALHGGPERVDAAFKRVFDTAESPHAITALARLIGPGVHVTALRNHWLEYGVARAMPDTDVVVLRPGDDPTEPVVLRRPAGKSEWERIFDIEDLDAEIDRERDVVLVRLHRGYLPAEGFVRPVLTEDDHLLELHALDEMLPERIATLITKELKAQPTLLVGLSLLQWDHRSLLRRLFPESFPKQSLAILEPKDSNRKVWEKGSWIWPKSPQRPVPVAVVETSHDELAAWLEVLATERGS